MNKPLHGQVAIITGASRGVGREVALAFAKAGANIVVVAKSTESTPNLPGSIYTVAKEVEELGQQALPIKCDVRIDEEIDNVVETTIQQFGRIDILVCNAGALWWKNVMDTPMKRYDLVHSINSRATFAFTRAVLPHMLKQKHGHIITMSPPIDLGILKGRVAYCISKFGMTMLAHGLAEEIKGSGVAINALWPATLVESYATINFGMGERGMWRKASILSDSSLLLVQEDPMTFTGQALIDEDYLRSKGVTSLDKYRCDPNMEPLRITNNTWKFEAGLVSDVKKKASL